MPIAARFHDLRDLVLDTVDDVFAEPVRLSFMKNGAVDPDRAAVDIEALLRVGGGKLSRAEGGAGRAWRSKIASGKAELHINAAAYSGPQIRTADAVRALARPGQPWFEVLRVDDRGENRLVLELGEK